MKRLLKDFFHNFTKRTVLLTIIFVTVSLVVINTAFNATFWQNFLANLLSTFIGIIVGIPIAVILSRVQEIESEQERKHKILRIISKELLDNQTLLRQWKDFERDIDKEEGVKVLDVLLKVESWNAFSDGGELEWIKDPVLLAKLSEAYHYIKSVQTLCARHSDARISSGNASTISSRGYFISPPRMLTSVFEHLKDGIECAEVKIQETIRAIGQEINIESPP